MNNQQAVAVQKMNTVRDLLINNKAEIASALPKHLTADRLIRIAVSSIQKVPKLLECDQKSLFSAIMQSAQLGLEPDGLLGQAYLIPYAGKVQFQVGFKGLIALARRSGEIMSITAQVVYVEDHFEFEYGIDEKLRHVPFDGDRGAMKLVYAIAKFKDGGYQFEVMYKGDVEKIRNMSQTWKKYKKGPWVDHPESMWTKTALKKLCKLLPMAIEAQRAAALDELNDLGIKDGFLDDDDLVKTKTDQKSDKLAETLKDAKKINPEPDEGVGDPEEGKKKEPAKKKAEKKEPDDGLYACEGCGTRVESIYKTDKGPRCQECNDNR